MLTFKEVTEDNYFEYSDLKVSEEQWPFITDPVASLAHAWLYYERARPFAIYSDETMVGYLMLDIDYDCGSPNKTCAVWRLMIDEKHQGKGYGKIALEWSLQYLRGNCNPDIIRVNLIRGNDIAESMYKSFGFVESGEVYGKQFTMILNLKSM